MSKFIPSSRPAIELDKITKLINRHGWEAKQGTVFCVAIRGYYLDTMGKPGKNDYGIHDDAFCWIWPDGYTRFNGNTDPSRLGWNKNAGKYMARLKPGIYDMIKWKHKGQYWAFGQGGNPVTVERVDSNGVVQKTEKGVYGINIHRSGVNGTSSEGCLTIPTQGSQWTEFQSLGYKLLDKYKIEKFKLMLFDEEEEKKKP